MNWEKIIQEAWSFCSGGLVGGLIGYFIRTWIDSWQKGRERKRQYSFEDLKKQRELLLEFMGKPRTDFNVLINVGQTYPADQRLKMIKGIRQWIDKNQQIFPRPIQDALFFIGQVAGSIFSDLGLALIQRPEGEGKEKLNEAWRKLNEYMDELDTKLGIKK